MNYLAVMQICKQKLELQSCCDIGGFIREARAKADM